MRNVDKILIIQFVNKSSATGDQSIVDGTRDLAARLRNQGRPVDIHTFYSEHGTGPFDGEIVGISGEMAKPKNARTLAALDGMRQALRGLTKNSELILRGHGNVDLALVCGIGGTAMANFLCDMGLAVDCKINITSCKAGRGMENVGADSSTMSAMALSEKSFARDLIHRLCQRGLRNVVHARVQNVVINANGTKTTRQHGSSDSKDRVHKQADSKIIFACDANGFASSRYASYP